jgi:hypothetical protein
MRDHVTCLLTTSYALSICELSCFFIVKSIRTALMRETSAVVVQVNPPKPVSWGNRTVSTPD